MLIHKFNELFNVKYNIFKLYVTIKNILLYFVCILFIKFYLIDGLLKHSCFLLKFCVVFLCDGNWCLSSTKNNNFKWNILVEFYSNWIHLELTKKKWVRVLSFMIRQTLENSSIYPVILSFSHLLILLVCWLIIVPYPYRS